ncbi:MAG TPA: hypothetical protein VM888_01200 [Chitinophagaceae bacterium]|nr:hypothetical protein [Chitinophagaceae bacterium]
MAVDSDKINKSQKDCDEEMNKSENLTSNAIPNAHAAGDGAVGRSKEAITEEDIHPDKEKEDNNTDKSAY